jgi:hypothetical protein
VFKQKPAASIRYFAIAIVMAIAVAVAFSSTVNALAKSYNTDDSSIKVGMVVATIGESEGANDDNALVQKANQTNGDLAVGIVTDINASDISYADNNKGELLVASTGEVSAYVSDINGVPKAGDLLVPSQLEGILMRADKNTKGVIGVAVSNFPDDALSYPLKDGYSAKIAIISVNMDIHPVSAKPINAVQDLASRIVGHDVSLIQTLIAGAIFLMTIVVVGGMGYGAVVNYVSSIGRNPLGKKILRRGLIRVFALVLIVLAVGTAVSWVVLWL